MIDWQKTASNTIGEVHRNLPADADHARPARKSIIDRFMPWFSGRRA